MSKSVQIQGGIGNTPENEQFFSVARGREAHTPDKDPKFSSVARGREADTSKKRRRPGFGAPARVWSAAGQIFERRRPGIGAPQARFRSAGPVLERRRRDS